MIPAMPTAFLHHRSSVHFHPADVPVRPASQIFTCSCTADNNLFSFNRIQIIGVHRLPVFFHHIIRNIYKIIDRTDSMCTKTFLHPLRRWGKLNILYNSCRVTAAKILILYRYFDVIIDIFVISGFCYDRRYKFLMERGCCLTRNAEYGKQSTRLDVISYSTTLSSSPK